MATEKPLNLEQFFITRNELATKHNSKLELQAMARIRAHLVEDMEAKALFCRYGTSYVWI